MNLWAGWTKLTVKSLTTAKEAKLKNGLFELFIILWILHWRTHGLSTGILKSLMETKTILICYYSEMKLPILCLKQS